MATKTRKTRAKAKAKTKTKTKTPKRTTKRSTRAKSKAPAKRRTAATATPRTAKPILTASTNGSGGLTMSGERLVVKLARQSHPEVFAIDKLCKQITNTIEEFDGHRKMRDVVEFLRETEKSLGIILSNHLEDALRKYLR